MSLRRQIGALFYDLPRLLLSLPGGRWIHMRNRNERTANHHRGVRCDWEFTSEIHIANVFPRSASQLMRAAFRQWPVAMRDAPPVIGAPEVSFVIGHRGMDRLSHLLTTLRSIAGQRDVAVECVVIEQDSEPRVKELLPSWVRYEFTNCSTPYNRAATLNTGVAMARGATVVLHDNDMVVPARYAAECVERVHEGYEFIEIKRFTFYLDEQATRHVMESGQPPRGIPATVVQNLLGASIAASRDSYFRAGGFDEEFIGWGGEDNEFWERAEATGRTFRFGYLPFIHLYHAPQKQKADPNAPAVRRYDDLRKIPARERIATLAQRRGEAQERSITPGS